MKKWNRLLSVLLVICMVFALMPTLFAAGTDKTYIDVTEDAWFYRYVMDMTKKGLVNGITDETFGPEDNIQRGQIVTILYRAAGIKDEDITWEPTFTDVPEDQYYYKPAAWAEKEKVVNGKGEGLFDPEGFATREELVTILYRYAKAEAAEADFAGFTDGDKVSGWARDAFSWAVANKIIGGKPIDEEKIALDPQGNTTRAEASKIFSVWLSLDDETEKPTETEEPSETEESIETEGPTETEPPTEPDETVEPIEGEFAVFNPANEKALARKAIPTGKYHNRAVMAVDAKLTEDQKGLTTAAADIAVFTMTDHETYVTFKTQDDMYLCANGVSGTEIYYAATEDLPGTHFTLKKAEGGTVIGSEIAQFDGTGKCLEFYEDSFKLWGLDEGADTAPFAMKFLPVTENTAPVHTLEKVEAKAATETEPGNREHWKCSKCGALFLDAEGKYPATAEQVTLPALNTIPKGLAVYNPEANTALSKTPKEYRGIQEFEAVQNVRLSVDGKALYTETPDDLLLFDKIETTEDGVTTFQTADSKYLAFDGKDLHLVDADTDGDTHFVLEDAGNGLKFIRSENYKYKETEPAYIRYNGGYNSKCFHIYKKAAVVATEFAFGFYPVEGTSGPAVSSVYINNQKHTCAVGSKVELDAGTYPGFTFDGWQCIGTKVADPKAAKTSFIVPDCKVEITATWKNENKLAPAAELKVGDKIVITALDCREGNDTSYVFDVATKNFCRVYENDVAPSCVFEVIAGEDGKIGLKNILTDLGSDNLLTTDANNGSIKHKIVFTNIGTDLTPVYDAENQIWKILTDIAIDKKGNETQKQMGVNFMKDGNMHFRSYNETNYTAQQPDQYGNYYFGDLVIYKIG